MTLLNALCIAFATYSRIPMPKVEWNERNMRISLCFFPLVGVFLGGALILWHMLCQRLEIAGLPRGAVSVFITLLITGGIHMDGFMDTTDALSSYGDREKKLRILKDSHVGAFGAMGCALYFLVAAGALGEALPMVFALGYVLSRALAALMIVVTPSASTEFLKMFTDSVQRRAVLLSSAACLIIIGALAVAMDFRALFALIGLIILALWHRAMAVREFGGMTGDLIGWLVMASELVYLLIIAISGRVVL